MAPIIGIICAFVAMFAWGFGDYLIQRSTRWIGDWETLFIISLVGAIVLAPFSLGSLITIAHTGGIGLLSLASAVLLFAALLEFESLREGKLAVVESLWSTEIITSILLAFFLIGERLVTAQVIVIVMLIIGLILVSVRKFSTLKRSLLEKASVLAVVSALVMGCANFLFGLSARATDPLVTNFATSLFLALCSGTYLIFTGRMKVLWRALCRAPFQLIGMTLLDNIAWIAFAFAMTLAPIGIAVTLSESYIIVAILLGLSVNHEKLRRHQVIGLMIAVAGAIVLAAISI